MIHLLLSCILYIFLFRKTYAQSKPVYNIGILFPNTSNVIATDPSLADMIVTSELAIQLAAQSIQKSNILPDVQLNFTRFYSDESNPGKTSWTSVKMVESGVDAVIGDMISSMTKASAAVTGLYQIPQCSCASASYDLTDKSVYPYFFRTVGSVVLYGNSLVSWIDNMNWGMFALIYTNDAVGQQVLHTMVNRANELNIKAMTQIPLYSMDDSSIEAALTSLDNSGSRVVVLADSDTSDQMTILNKALQMGLLSKGWVWMLTNDISPVIQSTVKPEEWKLYDGLMFISGLWDLSGETAYDSLNQIWQAQRVPEEFTSPSEWNTTGLSYNAPSAYACAELLALGLNHALDIYPGGRSVGLQQLSSGKFNSSNMTPTFYNLNYTGPAGYMSFSDTGDLESGYFQILFMKNGSSIPYGTVKLEQFEFLPNVNITYLGQTTVKPHDMVERYAVNPTLNEPAGIIIIVLCSLGILCCFVMLILIFLFREMKQIMVSSPFFCYLQLVGICLGYVATALFVDKPTIVKCILRQILMTIGFVLVTGSIISKNYRIYRIFQNVFTVRASHLKSCFLLRIVLVFGIIALVPLIIWYAIYPMSVEDVMISTSDYCWLCTYPTANNGNWVNINAAELVVLIWCAFLIVLSAFFAYKTRGVDCKWSETRQISYVSYNIGLAAIVVSPSFFLSIDNYVIAIYLKIASVLFAATFSLVVLYLPKFLLISSYIIKHSHLSIYQVNGDSKAELTGNDEQLNKVAKEMYDFTVKAHQGVLPVKKLAKFDFLSIWELKQITLLPTRRVFVLSDQDGHNAHQYSYISCEIINEKHFIFRVCTEDHHSFLFQVRDQSSAERWIAWFNCVQIEEEKVSISQPITTFGSSYNLSHYINDIQSHYIPPSNSFGVVDESWQRYP